MPTSNSSSNFLFDTLSEINLGNGLIDLGALTTIIGSTVAESLVLGNKGSAGVSWSAMSAFGTFSIIRACIGAAVSGWMRETLGLRTKSCDLAIGMHLKLEGPQKARDGLGSPLAIMCETDEQSESDVYAFDQGTLSLLEGVPETLLGSPLVVYTYAQYDFFTPSRYRVNLTIIILSLAKIAEIQVLWTRGSPVLAIATALPWSIFFLFSIAVLITEGYPSGEELGPIDLLTGQLPHVKRPGGPRLVVLGVHRNPRRTAWWRVAWGIGALVCTGSILFTYASLSGQPSAIVILWTGFQVFWLVARLVVHYFTAPSDRQRMLVATALDRLSPDLKGRVLNLTMALGKYLTYIHPRGHAAYQQDLFSSQNLPTILDCLSDEYPVEDAASITVRAVIGDTVLSAAAWVLGLDLHPMNLYDSCIVMFDHIGKTISIPAIRVLSGASPVKVVTDPEKPYGPSFVPKGSPNLGYGLTWHYWVPAGHRQWIHLAVPGTGALGKHNMEVVTDAEVNAVLSAGQLNIGLTKVEELWEAVKASTTVAQALQQFY
ncbi:hypothetical protein GYMLUDRAFT_239586 [Collybiopsis luxurians FD-317 M1]|nr:hypothetical protein GYMLUDRAFT_239586 [Collybiopsis luxurians FD-317 M1]